MSPNPCQFIIWYPTHEINRNARMVVSKFILRMGEEVEKHVMRKYELMQKLGKGVRERTS